jgi:hypothetical protein
MPPGFLGISRDNVALQIRTVLRTLSVLVRIVVHNRASFRFIISEQSTPDGYLLRSKKQRRAALSPETLLFEVSCSLESFVSIDERIHIPGRMCILASEGYFVSQQEQRQELTRAYAYMIIT